MIRLRVLMLVVSMAVLAAAPPPTRAQAAPGSAVGAEPQGVSTAAATSKPQEVAVPRNLSPWAMFLGADIVVKAVMIGLASASLATWTIFLAKSVELGLARRRLRRAMARLGDARGLPEARRALEGDGTGLAAMIAAAETEFDFASGLASRVGAKERAESRFADYMRLELQAARRGMGLLATIGSVAPFVGLFGTVWGIMNSFIGISKAQTTNLAVVAPGIAEALLATAVGLVAAIPAVILYNHFSRATRAYQLLLQSAVGAVSRLFSREIDRQQTVLQSRAAE